MRILLSVGIVVFLFYLSSCSLAVQDTRTPAEATAVAEQRLEVQATAQAIDAEEAEQVDCRIAGNVSRAGEKIYHLPGGQYYSRVKIDLSAGEEWLCSEEEAAEKGYRKAER